MRVLVTGAAGTLGTALAPRLGSAGHEPVAFDVRRGAAEAEWRLGDVRDRAAVDRAMQGADVVVHAAALHGIHLRDHRAEEFHDLNLTGTFNVWQSAVRVGVRGVVFSSTMGVYGESRRAPGDDAVAWVHEDLPLEPTEIYGWTKLAGEELCRYHLREHGIASVALRFGMFVPEPFFREGIRYLYGGVHVADVVESVMAAVAAITAGRVRHLAVNVESPLPFTQADAADLRRDPLVAIERHWPGSAALLRDRGVERLTPVEEVFRTDRLVAALGVTARHSFGSWLEELERQPRERATASPPWP
jgi:UDP-glucose 4-epimerase